jgi:pimeloyl-ACP methyl ester carboxylesterase
MADAPHIVLVHGAFVDGSGWEGVYRLLTAKGFTVSVVQHPTITLSGDVDYVSRAVEAVDGPAILVGHSYGGVVITEAGRHPQVKALVYVAAWLPDAGESVNALIAKLPKDGPLPPLAPRDGFLFVDPAKFPDAFAQDVDRATAEFQSIAQLPWAFEAAGGTVGEPAWKTKPAWYLVSADDRMIPPPAQRDMAAHAGAKITESPGSHSIFVSHPDAVAKLVEEAAASVFEAAA